MASAQPPSDDQEDLGVLVTRIRSLATGIREVRKPPILLSSALMMSQKLLTIEQDSQRRQAALLPTPEQSQQTQPISATLTPAEASASSGVAENPAAHVGSKMSPATTSASTRDSFSAPQSQAYTDSQSPMAAETSTTSRSTGYPPLRPASTSLKYASSFESSETPSYEADRPRRGERAGSGNGNGQKRRLATQLASSQVETDDVFAEPPSLNDSFPHASSKRPYPPPSVPSSQGSSPRHKAKRRAPVPTAFKSRVSLPTTTAVLLLTNQGSPSSATTPDTVTSRLHGEVTPQPPSLSVAGSDFDYFGRGGVV